MHARFFLFVFACLPLAALAEGPAGYATELKLLSQQRDKELAAATGPVLRRYKESLLLLQKKAMQGGDLETANKIKDELAKMGEATPASEVTAEASAAIYVGKKWGWFAGEGANQRRAGTLEFRDNGVLIKQGLVETFIDRWEPMPNRMVKVKHNNGNFWVFRFDPAKNEATVVKTSGSIDDKKTLRPLD